MCTTCTHSDTYVQYGSQLTWQTRTCDTPTACSTRVWLIACARKVAAWAHARARAPRAHAHAHVRVWVRGRHTGHTYVQYNARAWAGPWTPRARAVHTRAAPSWSSTRECIPTPTCHARPLLARACQVSCDPYCTCTCMLYSTCTCTLCIYRTGIHVHVM